MGPDQRSAWRSALRKDAYGLPAASAEPARIPIRIAVRVDFSDGSQHEYEVRGKDAVPAPGGFWPEGVVTSDVAQRIDYARKRAEEIEKLKGQRHQAVKLLEAALHLAQNGEMAPGGDETWAQWWRDVEVFLRARLGES